MTFTNRRIDIIQKTMFLFRHLNPFRSLGCRIFCFTYQIENCLNVYSIHPSHYVSCFLSDLIPSNMQKKVKRMWPTFSLLFKYLSPFDINFNAIIPFKGLNTTFAATYIYIYMKPNHFFVCGIKKTDNSQTIVGRSLSHCKEETPIHLDWVAMKRFWLCNRFQLYFAWLFIARCVCSFAE